MKKILSATFCWVLLGACSSSAQPDAARPTEPSVALTENAVMSSSPTDAIDQRKRATQVSAKNPSMAVKDPQSSATPDPSSLAARPEVQAFIQDMVAQHNFNTKELTYLFSRIRSRSDVIALMTRPAEAKPWHAYRNIFITPKRIQGGVTFWKTHEAALARAEKVYGVPAEIIVAIIGVETAYGEHTGKHGVLEALATLAFDYPRRADFFRKELENYLLLTREEGIDPLSLQGSYAGASGIGQFMPSSYRAYAIDFDGDQQRDLWKNPEDTIGSVANYLKEHRWERGQPITTQAQIEGEQYQALISERLREPTRTVASFKQRDIFPEKAVDDSLKAMLLEFQGKQDLEYWLGFKNFYVITRYNRSPLYAMAIYQLSQDIRRHKNKVSDSI
jgi:membrane-bound lytic murein transglycosylase B